MEALVQRMRLAMNLVLAFSLLLVWGLSIDRPDVLSIVTKMVDDTRSFVYGTTGRSPPPDLGWLPDGFREIYELVDNDVSADRTTLIRPTLVTQVLTIRSYLESEYRDLLERDPTSEEGQAITAYQAIDNAHDQLRLVYYKSGLGPGATVGELIEYTEAGVRIPVINESVKIKTAFWVFTTAASVILLYLLSYVIATDYVARSGTSGEGRDWIFFHPGWLGPVIGSMWVLAPASVSLFGMLVHAGKPFATLVWIIVLGSLAGVVIFRSLRTRRFILYQSEADSQISQNTSTKEDA